MSVNVLCRVHKHKCMLVFVNLHGLKFTAYKLAENTVVHSYPFLSLVSAEQLALKPHGYSVLIV